MQQSTPGKSREKFIKIIQDGVKIRNMEMNQNGSLNRDIDIERMKKALKNSSCVHSLRSISNSKKNKKFEIKMWKIKQKIK